MNVITCSAKEARELLRHMDDDDLVTLTIINRKTYIHGVTKRIQKRKGEELIDQADNICYQNNDFFGVLSLYGVLREKDIIHNILFHQLE